MNTITERWRLTGLLDDLASETECDEVSAALESMVQRLQQDVPPYTHESELVSDLILAIIRRLYDDIVKLPLPPTEWIYNDFKQFCIDKKELKEDWDKTAMHRISADAEFIAYYVHDVVCRLG